LIPITFHLVQWDFIQYGVECTDVLFQNFDSCGVVFKMALICIEFIDLSSATTLILLHIVTDSIWHWMHCCPIPWLKLCRFHEI